MPQSPVAGQAPLQHASAPGQGSPSGAQTATQVFVPASQVSLAAQQTSLPTGPQISWPVGQQVPLRQRPVGQQLPLQQPSLATQQIAPHGPPVVASQTQMPAVQLAPVGQVVPQVPQLPASVCGSTQNPPQQELEAQSSSKPQAAPRTSRVAMQVPVKPSQMPEQQSALAAQPAPSSVQQASPEVAQVCVRGSQQRSLAAPQTAPPLSQAHLQSLPRVCPTGQGATHRPPQAVNPMLHVTPQTPLVQVVVPFAVWGQRLPQPPQFLGSVAKTSGVRHAPLQAVAPTGQTHRRVRVSQIPEAKSVWRMQVAPAGRGVRALT